MIFTDLTVDDRRDIIDYVSDRTGLSRIVVEKGLVGDVRVTGDILTALFR